MDPLLIITELVKAATAICNHAKTVKANRAQFLTLSQRIHTLTDTLQGLDTIPDSRQFRAGLKDLQQVIQDTTEFLNAFSAKKWFKRVLKASDNKAKFKDLNHRLGAAIQLLNLGVSAQSIINREQDLADQKADRLAVAALQEEITRLHQAELEAMQRLNKETREYQAIMKQQMASLRLHLETVLAGEKKPRLPVDRHLVVAFHDVLFDQVIGQGAFGTVYAGRWQTQPVAIKTIHGIQNATQEKQFIREAQIMSRLRSRYITQFYGVCLEPTRQFLLMEYMERDSLWTYLSHMVLTREQQKTIALEIAHGLRYLHAQGVTHGDLKSANVLLDGDLHAKLSDFGLSTIRASSVLDLDEKSKAVQWMAPELLTGGELTPASDVYSYGMLLWEITVNKQPFAEFVDDMAVSQHVVAGGRELIPMTVPREYQAMIEGCWSKEPSKRPSLDVIIDQLERYEPRPPSPTPEALYEEACVHEREKRYELARDRYYRAAEKGYLSAKTSYALLLVLGLGGDADKAQAFLWFCQAAEAGHARAQYNAGQMLEYGDGVEKDLNRALFWYECAKAQSYEGVDRRMTRVREKLEEEADAAASAVMR